jgi:hypothetical protein
MHEFRARSMIRVFIDTCKKQTSGNGSVKSE